MTEGNGRPTIADLIERHHTLLYRYAYRLSGSSADAEDLTQQTYLIAHEKLHQLRDSSSAKSWLCTILRHAYLRDQRTRISGPALDAIPEPWNGPAKSDYDEEGLRRALGEMNEEYRSAVILYYFQELSYQEIAQVLEVPLGTVMSRLSRGKMQLKELLERHAFRETHPPAKPAGDRPRLVPLFPG